MPTPLRTLNVIPTLPYPPRTGAHLRAWNLCNQLKDRLAQTLLCRVMEPAPPEHLAPFAERGIDVHALHIPRPNPATRALKAFLFLFSRYPVMLAGWDHRAMRKRLRLLLSENVYDIVVLEGSPLCVYVPELRRTRALRVVHLYDLEAEYLAREARLMSPGPRRAAMRLEAYRMIAAERHMLESADLILVCSDRERDILRRRDPRLRIVTVPNGVDLRTRQRLPRSTRRELLYVGSLRYHPNVDAVHNFVREVWPALRARLPDIGLRVVGKQPPPEILKLDGRDGIVIAGEVEDVRPHYETAAACVVPLRVGGGTRVKILEAMAFGRPVISTSLGCEGLDVEHGRHLLIGNTGTEMLSQIERLFGDRELEERLVSHGRDLVERRYSWDRIADDLYAAYVQCLRERQALSPTSAPHDGTG